ncbi:MAG: hypothetical protein JNM98_06225 [Rhodocyclaceae bacterium]|nr:hypothetical protein [Rhodocyclaceae bacterium]
MDARKVSSARMASMRDGARELLGEQIAAPASVPSVAEMALILLAAAVWRIEALGHVVLRADFCAASPSMPTVQLRASPALTDMVARNEACYPVTAADHRRGEFTRWSVRFTWVEELIDVSESGRVH